MNYPDIREALPLPLALAGIERAAYVGDVREIVQYDIRTDGYQVRYDWLDAKGCKRTLIPDPIHTGVTPEGYEWELRSRWVALMKHRENEHV